MQEAAANTPPPEASALALASPAVTVAVATGVGGEEFPALGSGSTGPVALSHAGGAGVGRISACSVGAFPDRVPESECLSPGQRQH